MPDLDVSFMTVDPMFADSFAIKRRAQTVSVKGRAVNASTTIPNQIGVITQREPSELERVADGDSAKRRITLCSIVQILGPVVGNAPDIIVWNGTEYLVTEVLPYSRFGAGTYETKAESMTQPDVAQ